MSEGTGSEKNSFDSQDSRSARLPPGQHWAKDKFPVLDLGIHPKIAPEEWSLEIGGLVERPLTFSWEEFHALPQIEDVSDFHCVTTWSVFDARWGGVRFSERVVFRRYHRIKPVSQPNLLQDAVDHGVFRPRRESKPYTLSSSPADGVELAFDGDALRSNQLHDPLSDLRDEFLRLTP